MVRVLMIYRSMTWSDDATFVWLFFAKWYGWVVEDATGPWVLSSVVTHHLFHVPNDD